MTAIILTITTGVLALVLWCALAAGSGHDDWRGYDD